MDHKITGLCRKAFRKAASVTTALAMPLMMGMAMTSQATAATATTAAMATPVMASAGLTAGAVTFGAPWVLLGLSALPVLWWLMRTIPPKPKSVDFPAMRLLWALESEDQQPAKMPLWQRILRMTALTACIVGMAQPEMNKSDVLEGQGPVLLVVDNGWASADNWTDRTAEMENLLDQADDSGRSVLILATAPPENGDDIAVSNMMSAAQAREFIKGMKPQPWSVDRAAAAAALSDIDEDTSASIVWLSNGLDSLASDVLAQELDDIGNVTVISDEAEDTPYLLSVSAGAGDDLVVTVRRAHDDADDSLYLTASDEAGNALGQIEVGFDKGQTEVKTSFDLPLDVRNQLTKVAIDGENSAGGVFLLDERWRRRPVGLIESDRAGAKQSLLDGNSYVEKALDPYVDLHQGELDGLLTDPLSVLVMTDSAMTNESDRQKINEWVKAGGVLLRFAGPNLAVEGDDNDSLFPVDLLDGARDLSGGITQVDGIEVKGVALAPFEKNSPFYGIEPSEKIYVNKEILAAPSLGLDDQTWAQLEDGTPLVTAQKRGKGQIVFVHTAADASWSNLPLSGMFVEMLRIVVAQSQGLSGEKGDISQPLKALKIIDGQGQLTVPSSHVEAITQQIVSAGIVQPENPPGFYGNDNIRHAHNLAGSVTTLKPLGDLPLGVKADVYDASKDGNKWTGILLAAALSLMFVDIVTGLGQRGYSPLKRGKKKKQDKKGLAPS